MSKKGHVLFSSRRTWENHIFFMIQSANRSSSSFFLSLMWMRGQQSSLTTTALGISINNNAGGCFILPHLAINGRERRDNLPFYIDSIFTYFSEWIARNYVSHNNILFVVCRHNIILYAYYIIRTIIKVLDVDSLRTAYYVVIRAPRKYYVRTQQQQQQQHHNQLVLTTN